MGRTQKYNIHCNNSGSVCKLRTHHICFLKETRFLKSGRGWFPNNRHNHNRGLPLSFFFFSLFHRDIFGGALCTIHKVLLLLILLPLQCCDSWWVGVFVRHERPELSGSQAPLSIKGRASHPDYWASNDGTPFLGFPLVIFGTLQVCSEFRARPQYSLLSSVHVMGRCLLGRRARLTTRLRHLQIK